MSQQALIVIEGEACRRVQVQTAKGPIEFETRYPPELLELIFRIKGPDFILNEIARDENEYYVAWELRHDLLAYLDPEDLVNRRILDFGSGAGASSMILARLFPQSNIIGIELDPGLLEIARGRLAYYQYPNVRFEQSPSGLEIPPDLGQFSVVVLSAVYEHLLPDERPTILDQLWHLLEPGGILIIDQTPHRYWPIEKHTTSLPLINYLPLSLACACARRFSSRTYPGTPCEVLLRHGLRGGTAGEILNLLKRQGHQPCLLKPSRLGMQSHADLWYAISTKGRANPRKKLFKYFCRAAEGMGLIFTPALSLAIQKSK